MYEGGPAGIEPARELTDRVTRVEATAERAQLAAKVEWQVSAVALEALDHDTLRLQGGDGGEGGVVGTAPAAMEIEDLQYLHRRHHW